MLRLFLFAAAVAAAAPAFAEQTGIAFVQAPEQSVAMCTGPNPDRAFACARKNCVADGALAADCARMAWCFPAGWSADIFLQHREGPHWHEFTCGWDSLDAAKKAAALKCDRAARPYLIECATVGLYDPDGKAVAE